MPREFDFNAEVDLPNADDILDARVTVEFDGDECDVLSVFVWDGEAMGEVEISDQLSERQKNRLIERAWDLDAEQ